MHDGGPLRLAISEGEDDTAIRRDYRPFLLPEHIASDDWVARLELDSVSAMVEAALSPSLNNRLRILILYGSLRPRSFARLVALECARILFRLGCDVRVFDPVGLPIKDNEDEPHPKVDELRRLSEWSEGHLWVSPEQHGNLTAVMKNQIDWFPLGGGAVRHTQARTLAIAQVNGGSQSFNTVNSLRILGRWMRMFTICNQSSIPKVYSQFTDEDSEQNGNRLIPSSNRDRIVDCMEELVRYTLIMRPHFATLQNRFSERVAKAAELSKSQAQDDTNGKVVSGVDLGRI